MTDTARWNLEITLCTNLHLTTTHCLFHDQRTRLQVLRRLCDYYSIVSGNICLASEITLVSGARFIALAVAVVVVKLPHSNLARRLRSSGQGIRAIDRLYSHSVASRGHLHSSISSGSVSFKRRVAMVGLEVWICVRVFEEGWKPTINSTSLKEIQSKTPFIFCAMQVTQRI